VGEARSFGRYRVTGTLGAGGMGEVFAAVDEVLGREVAVKTLRGKHSGLAARLLDDRFRQEARAIAALSHPGVVQVFDIDLGAEPPYIVMERVAGPSLKQRIASGPLAVDELRALGIQISRALAAAHAGGILHRDVKPANILAAAGGAWKLADFGVAHVPDSEITMTGQFVGSPAYAPPEALVRGASGAPGDIYGLGAALYESALGRWPRTETTGALLAPVPALGTLAPHLPPEIAAAIDRAVATEPEARPTATELADALAGASSQPGTVPAVVAPMQAVVPTGPLGGSTPIPGIPSSGPTPIPGAPPSLDPTVDRSTPGSATPVPTVHGVAPGALPTTPAPALRWKPWAIGVGIVLLIGTVAALSSRSPAPAASSDATGSGNTTAPPPGEPPDHEPPDREPGPRSPDEIRAITPAIATTDRRADKDWRKLVDKLYKGDFREAHKKLDDFERRWGASDETRELRDQLANLPDREED